MYVVLLLLIFSPQLLQGRDLVYCGFRLEDISLVVDELYNIARSSAHKAR